MTINLVKHGKEMLDAYEKMLKGGTDHWFLLDYEPGNSHVLKLGDQGEDGLEEMASAFNSGRLQYGMATVKVAGSSQPKVLLVQWQGEGVKTSLLAPTANHVREVKLFFKGVHVVIHARNEDDVEASTLRQAVQRLPGASNGDKNQGHSDLPPTGPVHSVYERVRPGQDPALKSDRESFWKGVQMEEETRQSNERERMQLRDEAVKKDRDQLTQQIHQRQEENNTTTAINKKMDKGVQREGETRLSNERHRMQLRDEVVKTEIHQRQEGNNPTMTINKKMDNIPHHPVKNTYSPSPLPPPSQSIIDHNRDIPFESEHSPVIESEQLDEPVQVEHDLIHKPTENNGSSLRAVALWDYAASDETEISFDPDDVITEIEMVDDGWWRGRGPDGHIGLFPANFVQLN